MTRLNRTPPRIALLMHNWVGYLHGVQLGISDYLVQRPEWIWTRMLPLTETFAQLASGRIDGMIAYVERDYIPALEALNIPIVDVANWSSHSPFPRVLPDDVAAGQMAARYFMDMGLRHFGVIGPTGAAFSDARQEGFIQALTAEGFTADIFATRPHTLRRTMDMPPGLNRPILSWLTELPQPAGVFATYDNAAAEVLEACRHAAIPVPEHICVLGVDNDELISRFSHPPLSSIALPTEKIGFEAARLLDHLMSGGERPADPIFLSPVRVVPRQSTNLLFIPDEDVLAAVRYIREHVHERVTVQELLRIVPVNRRYLERKFKKHVGRTPLQEIRRVRVDKARELLITTDMPMPAIARQSGFPNPERLANVFHASVGLTPSAYRKKHRPESMMG